VIKVEDDKDQVLPTTNVQASCSHDQSQASTCGTQLQNQQASTSSHDQPSTSNQVQIHQPTNIARDHPLDHIIGDIQRGAFLLCVSH